MLRASVFIVSLLVSAIYVHAQSPITITFVDSLEGDFSFVNRWAYLEGIYINQFEQLSCDGICPPETDAMKNVYGKIYADSLASFYKLVDTTHRYYTIQSESNFPEWAGTNYANVYIKKDLIIETEANAATHCVLKLVFDDNLVDPSVKLTSITNTQVTYTCIGGYLKVEKPSGNRDIIKTSFDLTFIDGDTTRYWRGKICAPVND